jgi:hypothetical protein
MCPLLSEAHNISDRTMYKHVSGRFLSRAQNQIFVRATIAHFIHD